MNPAFWRDRPVLITGHTGFKGAWASLWLQQLGAKVSGYALAAPTTPSLFESACVADGMRSLHGDVRDLDGLRAAFSSTCPEIVIHMAAQSLVRPSFDDPVGTYATNVMGTVNVLEAARHAGSVRAVVVVTSDKCYENREWHWPYRESDPMGGYDPYSSSKGCAELVTAAFRRSFFAAAPGKPAAVASARAGNVIGGGDWAQDRLVPDVMRAFARGEQPEIRHPGAVRPWQHVLEPLAGYLLLAERLAEQGAAAADAWNFGPDDADARPVAWVVDRLSEFWNGRPGGSWRRSSGPQPHEATYLKLDCSRAKALLGWRPRWDLATALARTVEWYRAAAAGGDVREHTLSQIAAYQRAVTEAGT